MSAQQAQHLDEAGHLMTDDFTPAQAITRIADNVLGDII